MFGRLIMKKNWENYEYYINDTKVEQPEKKITKVAVRWNSDVPADVYDTIWESEDVSYTDMGHTYNTKRWLMTINIEAYGYIIPLCICRHMNEIPVFDISVDGSTVREEQK